jgi:regulation of enolase protein 1 (concanavalin A-like superfamily)
MKSLNLILLRQRPLLAIMFLLLAFNVHAGVPPVITIQPTNQVVAAGSNATISVTASSATALNYQWYLNGGKILSATNSSLTVAKAQFTNAGAYYAAVANAYGTVNSSVMTLNVLAPVGSTLAAPWLTADIGAVGLTGSAYNISNSYSVNGAGASLVGAVADQFRYVYQTMVGDGSITARVISQTGTNAAGYAGIMIRESTATGSRFVFAAREGDGKLVTRNRATTGGATGSTNGPTYNLPNYWLQLVRTGNNIASSASTNGVSWMPLQTSSIVMASNVTFGLFVTSGSTNALTSVLFTNVTAVP